MTTVLGLTYAYDAAGNRVAVDGPSKRTGHPASVTAASYDAANELGIWSGVTRTHDANGNLTTAGPTTYTWNARNELTGITGGGVTATFAYDALGRRTRRTVNGTTTTFAYDGRNRVKTTVGGVASLMMQGLGLDDHFARIDGAAVTSFLADAIGSTYTLTDGTGGVTAQYGYEPYGGATKLGGAGATDLLFTGREDDGTGLLYYRARLLSPSTGRFVSEDPIELDGGINLYAYVGNSPLMWVDPFGWVRCVYAVTDHRLRCTSDDGTLSFETDHVRSGVPGDCQNNPGCEDIGHTGPIPRGNYRLGRLGDTPPHRVPRVPINPRRGTNVYGRTAFQIHPGGPGNSEGCITLDPSDYQRFRDFYRRDNSGILEVRP